MRSISKQKKGISVIVGYVLLITISLSLSFLVYEWMKRQTPKSTTECPETLSMIFQDYSCDTTNNVLNLTLKNNGLYDIQGAIIKVSNSTLPPIYPLELIGSSPSGKVKNISGNNIEYIFTSSLSASSNEQVIISFSYSKYNEIKKISIIPLYDNGKEKLICSNQEIQQILINCD